MPAIPAVWRKWLYVVGIAFVPVTQAFGWIDDNKAIAITGLVYAVFMGGLAAANVQTVPVDQFQEAAE
jgi:hypothetical protein